MSDQDNNLRFGVNEADSMFVDGYQEGFWVIWISCLLQDKEPNNSKQMQSDVSSEPLILAKCSSEFFHKLNKRPAAAPQQENVLP